MPIKATTKKPPQQRRQMLLDLLIWKRVRCWTLTRVWLVERWLTSDNARDINRYQRRCDGYKAHHAAALSLYEQHALLGLWCNGVVLLSLSIKVRWFALSIRVQSKKAPAEAEAVKSECYRLSSDRSPLEGNDFVCVYFDCSFIEQMFRFSLNFRSNTRAGPLVDLARIELACRKPVALASSSF